MSAPMQKLRIDPSAERIELRISGPACRKEEALRVLRPLGFVDASEVIPWRQAFPEVADADLPGVCLRGARRKEGLTQARLAELTGLPQRHISEMENGKRPIGKKNARLLAAGLGVSYKIFL